MEVRGKYVRSLLQMICERTGQELSRDGLMKAASQLKLAEQYLYKSLYHPIFLGEKGAVNLNDDIVSRLIKFLNYPTYSAFVKAMDAPIDPVLCKVAGTYWSYVRRNSNDGVLLCSPTRIVVDNNTANFELKGPNWTYRGEARLEGGCVFISMTTENGKSFHHVYKIGRALKPKILQGTFSGVSSAFDPIAGRCVLVRTEHQFDLMENEAISIESLEEKSGKLENALAKYFKERSLNNLIVEGITTNDIPDLTRQK
jgi:hypothetical protein